VVAAAADVASWISALAAAGAFGAAAYQLARLRREDLRRRVAEIRGVAVMTKVVVRPTRADAVGGSSRWVYLFTVHNPGHLPITNVAVGIRFPVPVTREHFDHSTEPTSETLEFAVPVISSRGTAEWERTVLIDHDRRHLLPDTYAEVRFVTSDAGPIELKWPDPDDNSKPNRKMLRYLRTSS
jgi:hypothetical protein